MTDHIKLNDKDFTLEISYVRGKAYVSDKLEKIAIGTLVEVDGIIFMYNGSEWESVISENDIHDSDPLKHTKSKKVRDW